MTVVGPLLAETLSRIEDGPGRLGFLAIASGMTMAMRSTRDTPVGRARPPQSALATSADVPVTALVRRRPPSRGESWTSYRDETLSRLERSATLMRQLGLEAELLVSATALQFSAAPDQLQHLARADEGLELIELDPPLLATALDDVPADIGLPSFHDENPTVDGRGVTVAVLDTGIDTKHPYLDVSESFNTSNEPMELPGLHGTHCAGIVASRDADFRGVAPGVRLLNVKVGRANGYVEPGNLARGFDAVADAGFLIISVSIGFNHRPFTSPGGHGWQCGRRPCIVCRAVDTAVRRGRLVVAAAGNEHDRAEALRRAGGAPFDTELCCPGQATPALTVGSVTKRDGLPASSSGRGPSSRGVAKPDIAAPGVNVTSTIPVPRTTRNRARRDAPRRELFGRESGTSMATPVVAATAALLAQRIVDQGHTPTPTAVKRALIRSAVPLPFGPDAVGAGRVHLF